MEKATKQLIKNLYNKLIELGGRLSDFQMIKILARLVDVLTEEVKKINE